MSKSVCFELASVETTKWLETSTENAILYLKSSKCCLFFAYIHQVCVCLFQRRAVPADVGGI